MSETLSIQGSVQIILSYDGIDHIINGPNAISTECYNYMLNSIVYSTMTLTPISNMLIYYNGIIGSTIVSVSKSRPTDTTAQFRSTISSLTNTMNIWQARLITAGNITYSTYSMPSVLVPPGYTISIDWTISAP